MSFTNEKNKSISEKPVKEMAKELENKLNPEKILNLKYVEQNFNMQKEIKIYQKKKEEKTEKK